MAKKLVKSKEKRECEESPDGKHSFVPDIEYDQTGQTINCEYCGEAEPAADTFANSGLATAVEYGYRACEKGKNLQTALAEFFELTRDPSEKPDREGGDVMGSYEERRDGLIRHLDERIRSLRK